MNSFYGGLNGQSFAIKKIFPTRHQMEMDLNNGWTSSISVGEFVVVSYGIPNDPNFDIYRNEDLRYYDNKTYNSTLWQKVYNETAGRAANGLSYKFIASMTGNTPKIVVTKPPITLDADQNPDLEWNNRDVDHPILTFKLPRSQNLLLDYPCGILDCDESPEVIMDDSNINYPVLYFALPQSQVIDKSTVTWLKVNQKPSVHLNTTDINRPVLEFSLPVAQVLQKGTTTVLDADKKPYFNIDFTDVDNPILNFALPQSQVLQKGTTTVLDADGTPVFNIDSTDINKPVLNFELPQSQVIDKATITWLKVNQKPSVNLNITDINKPVLEFSLPVAQSLQKGTTTILDADGTPSFDIDFTDIDNPVLKFSLPQSQVMIDPDVTIVNSLTEPNVTLNSSDINHPKLEFTLPRAVRFYYGSLLGERDDSPYTLTNTEFTDYEIGDYYINASTGFIYQVNNKTGTDTCEFTYMACIQSPLPDVIAIGVNPFSENEDGEFEPVQPVVVRSFTNNALTAWKLDFKLPRIPVPETEYDFVGSGEDGDVSVAPSAEDKVKFNFKIPQGSRMFAGLEVEGEGSYDVLDAIVGEAVPGDLYLNTKTGAVYKLDKSGVWKFQNDGLKGPVGDALNVVREYRIEDADDFDIGLNHIKDNYIDSNGDPLPYNPDELFAVTFVDEENDKETAYWYFFTEEEKWGRVQLTGGVSNMILNQWTESPETTPITNKTYSVDYINKLIGGNITDANKDKTAFSKDQMYALLSWGTMEDAKSDDWWPELGEDYDTLSAEEAISLLSWGSIAKLTI